MKKCLNIFLLFFTFNGVIGLEQTKSENLIFNLYDSLSFKNFILNFNEIEIPIDSNTLFIHSNSHANSDIEPSIVNKFIFESSDNPAFFINRNKEKERCEFYGKYPQKNRVVNSIEKINGKYVDVKKEIKSDLVSIGKINLSNKYETIIIKSETYESLTFDLWSFTKEGEVLSVISLYWKKKLARGIVSHNSTITEEGKIHWTYHTFSYQDNSMMKLYRTYQLNENGLFEVIEERKELLEK